MSDKLLEIFFQFRGFINTTVLATVVLMLGMLLLSLDFDIQNWRTKILGIFANMDTQDALKLSCSYLKLIFIAYYIISSQALNTSHYILFLLLVIIYILTKPSSTALFFNALNNLLLAGGLLFGNAISQFINQVRYELEIVIVYWLWGIFLILYAFFIFLNEVIQITSGKKAYRHDQSEESQ